MNHLAVSTAAFAAFVIGGSSYSPLLFVTAYARLRMPRWRVRAYTQERP